MSNRPPRKRRYQHPRSAIAAILEAARGHISEFSAALGRTRAYVAVITAMGLVALHYMPQPMSRIHLAAIAAFIAMALCMPLLGSDDE
jgi:hypothetical protein